MLEETSTSASATAAETPDYLFRSATISDCPNDSSLSIAKPLNFSSGNPRIEEIRGVVHLYRDDTDPSSSKLPVERQPLICVLGVPNHMTYADFCQFCGSFIQSMSEMRIVRTEGSEDRYSIFLRFEDQKAADSYYKHFNGKRFSSFEEETCHVYFTVDIQYTGSIEHSQAQLSAASSTEQPSCPVCLERLDQDAGGILITICNHSFHCSCISRWTDSSCPVCRFCQQQPEKSICYICQTTEKLWMCVICGFVGCGRYNEGHAVKHWKDTEHCYALELETQRVWDYAGDNYVHRLIQSKTDGKLVELNHHCMHHGDDNGAEYDETLLNSEFEAIKKEYNDLLTLQLESQKNYFESLQEEVETETKKEKSAAVDKALSQNPKLLKLQAKLDKCVKEQKFIDDINDNLLRNQDIWKSKIKEIKDRESKSLKVKDDIIEELEEQLRVLMTSLEAVGSEQQNLEQPETNSEEIKDEPTIVVESSSGNAKSVAAKKTSRRKSKGV